VNETPPNMLMPYQKKQGVALTLRVAGAPATNGHLVAEYFARRPAHGVSKHVGLSAGAAPASPTVVAGHLVFGLDDLDNRRPVQLQAGTVQRVRSLPTSGCPNFPQRADLKELGTTSVAPMVSRFGPAGNSGPKSSNGSIAKG